MARLWITPGTKHFEHIVGGLEKNEAGVISHDPINHQTMTNFRHEKIQNISNDIDLAKVYGPQKGDILLLSWGSTFGAIRQATTNLNNSNNLNTSVSHCHLTHINPFPRNLKNILQSFKKILIPENNLGQLAIKIQSEFNICIEKFSKVQGSPFMITEIEEKIKSILRG